MLSAGGPTSLTPTANPKPCRALDGDVVAVELLPESQWKGERSSLPQADAESTNGADEEDEDDPEGGHIAQARFWSSLAFISTSSRLYQYKEPDWAQACAPRPPPPPLAILSAHLLIAELHSTQCSLCSFMQVEEKKKRNVTQAL